MALRADREQFSIWSEQLGPEVHLHVTGALDMATAALLDGWLSRTERNKNTSTVLDLEHVTFMDTSGLHSFLRAADRASQAGRSFSIVNASSRVRRVLELTESTFLLDAPTRPDGRFAQVRTG